MSYGSALLPGWTHHAEDRLLHRYGVTATSEEWREALLAILDTVAGTRSGALLTRRMESGRERWRVYIAGADVCVVYDPDTACIITVVPVAEPKY